LRAKFTGGPAFRKANEQLERTRRNAQRVHVSFGMFTGIAGSAIALNVASGPTSHRAQSIAWDATNASLTAQAALACADQEAIG
jgi:hypothetical protein